MSEHEPVTVTDAEAGAVRVPTNKERRDAETFLYNADPDCAHVLDPDCLSGIRCLKCPGWFCL